jgi:hypothetical protein
VPSPACFSFFFLCFYKNHAYAVMIVCDSGGVTWGPRAPEQKVGPPRGPGDSGRSPAALYAPGGPRGPKGSWAKPSWAGGRNAFSPGPAGEARLCTKVCTKARGQNFFLILCPPLNSAQRYRNCMFLSKIQYFISNSIPKPMHF